MNENFKILFVDDDQNVLSSFQRNFHNRLNITTAVSGVAGLALLASEGPFAVIVSDYNMPEMNGIKFLTASRKISPDTTRIMLTGQADLYAAIDAVNNGNLFRFLSKPCSAEDLYNVITIAIEQYRLVVTEKELLEKTIHGSIKAMSEILAIVNPMAFGHSMRISKLAKIIATSLKLENIWEVEVATMLSQIGCVTIPASIIERKFQGQVLGYEEEKMYLAHPLTGKRLIEKIPRLNKVAEAIAYQNKQFDGGGTPNDGCKGPEIPIIARILKVALDFDLILTSGKTEAETFEQMLKNQAWYDPEILGVMANEFVPANKNIPIKEITVADLLPGMVIAEDIYTAKRTLLITTGQELNEVLWRRLTNFEHIDPIVEPIKIVDKS